MLKGLEQPAGERQGCGCSKGMAEEREHRAEVGDGRSQVTAELNCLVFASVNSGFAQACTLGGKYVLCLEA